MTSLGLWCSRIMAVFPPSLCRGGCELVGSINNWYWETIPLPGIVISYQPLGKFNPEQFEHLLSRGATSGWLEVLEQDECVQDTCIKQKPEDVSAMEWKGERRNEAYQKDSPIEFVTLHPHMIVAAQMVCSVACHTHIFMSHVTALYVTI